MKCVLGKSHNKWRPTWGSKEKQRGYKEKQRRVKKIGAIQ